MPARIERTESTEQALKGNKRIQMRESMGPKVMNYKKITKLMLKKTETKMLIVQEKVISLSPVFQCTGDFRMNIGSIVMKAGGSSIDGQVNAKR